MTTTPESPLVVVDTVLDPGRTGLVSVILTNPGPTPSSFTVRLLGLAESWTSEPIVVTDLAPGQSVQVDLPVVLPVGFPPSRQLVGVVAERPDGAPLRADVTLIVGEPAALTAELDRGRIRGRSTGRFVVRLKNPAPSRARVTLEALNEGGGLEVELPAGIVLVEPGATIEVKGRVRSRSTFTGRSRLLPFAVQVHTEGHSAPIQLQGSFKQRPTVHGSAFRTVAVVTAVAVWIAALGIGLNKLTDDDKDEKGTQIAQDAGEAAGGTSATGGGDNGGADSATGGGGASEGERGGDDDRPSGGIGSLGRVGGTVDASDPSGVTVTIEPVPLAGETVATAQPVNFRRSAVGGKRLASTSAAVQTANRRSTTTDPTGQWAFTGLRTPAYYLVTFTKQGYGTRSNVVQLTGEDEPEAIEVLLEPGTGALSGAIRGPAGPLGAVDVVVSNGDLSYATRTPSEGDPLGKWSIDGLPAPGTFLVTASRAGYGTQTTLVTLKPGQRGTGVDLQLAAGVGSITGKVVTAEGGIGNIAVSVTSADGNTLRESTSLTEGDVGAFNLPDLPIPGTYVVTVAGDGFTTGTQEVALTGSQSISIQVERTTSELFGVVRGEGGIGLENVGITVLSDSGRFSTASAADPLGAFSLRGIPPGTFAMTFERFQYAPTTVLVDTLTRGEVRELPDVQMTKLSPLEIKGTGGIQGTLIAGRTPAGQGVTGRARLLERDDAASPDDGVDIVDGGFEFNGLPPGIYNVSVDNLRGPNGTGFENTTQRVTVPFGVQQAAAIDVTPWASLSGTITSNAQAGTVQAQNRTVSVGGATVDLIPTDSSLVGTDLDPAPRAATLVANTNTATYSFDHQVPAGSYILKVTQPGYDEYTRAVTFEPGDSLIRNAGLTQRPLLEVRVYDPGLQSATIASNPAVKVLNSAGDLVRIQAGSLSDTDFCPAGAGTDQCHDDLDPSATVLFFAGLSPGTYTVVGRTYTSTETLGTGSMVVTLSNNTVSPLNIVTGRDFSPDLTGFVGWEDKSFVPVEQARIRLRGVRVAADNSGQAVTDGATVVTRTADPAHPEILAGSFTIPQADLPDTGTGDFLIDGPASLPNGFDSLTIPNIDFTAGAPVNQVRTVTEVNNALLVPKQMPLAGTFRVYNEGAPATSAPATLQVISAPNKQPLGDLRVVVRPSGFWVYDATKTGGTDCAASLTLASLPDQCRVRPGTYELKFTTSAGWVVRNRAAHLSNERTGFQDGEVTVFVPPGVPTTRFDEFEFAKLGTVTARVTDEAGTNLPGVTVRLTGAGGISGVSTNTTKVTDANGVATFPNLEPALPAGAVPGGSYTPPNPLTQGVYTVTAQIAGYRPIVPTSAASLAPGATASPQPLEFDRLSTISGTVAGSLLIPNDIGPVPLPPATTNPVVSPLGVQAHLRATITDLDETGSGWSVGTTFDALSNPSTGRFKFVGTADGSGHGYGLPAGTYAITLVRDTPDLVAGYDDPGTRTVTVRENKDLDLAVTVPIDSGVDAAGPGPIVLGSKTAGVSGRVFERYADGQEIAIAGATVAFKITDASTPKTTMTDGEGKYSFADLPAVQSSSLTVTKEGYLPQTATLVTLPRGGVLENQNIELPSTKVNVSVTSYGCFSTSLCKPDPAASPTAVDRRTLPNASVKLYRMRDTQKVLVTQGSTNSDGKLNLDPVPSSTDYTLEVTAAGFTAATPVAILGSGGSLQPVDVTLAVIPRDLTVEVRSAVTGLAPPSGIPVRLVPLTDGANPTGVGPLSSSVSLAGGATVGKADFSAVIPGRYTVETNVSGSGVNSDRGQGTTVYTVPLAPTAAGPALATIAEGRVAGTVTVNNGTGSTLTTPGSATVAITKTIGGVALSPVTQSVTLSGTGTRTGTYSFIMRPGSASLTASAGDATHYTDGAVTSFAVASGFDTPKALTIARKAELTVTVANDPAAKVTVDGVEKTAGSAGAVFNVEAGTYTIAVTSDIGTPDADGSVTLAVGEEKTVARSVTLSSSLTVSVTGDAAAAVTVKKGGTQVCSGTGGATCSGLGAGNYTVTVTSLIAGATVATTDANPVHLGKDESKTVTFTVTPPTPPPVP
jgi:hypothetical protein